MLDLLLNHSPTFLVGEVMLALSLGLFGLALAGTVRERYATRIRWRDIKQRIVPSKLAYNRPERTHPRIPNRTPPLDLSVGLAGSFFIVMQGLREMV